MLRFNQSIKKIYHHIKYVFHSIKFDSSRKRAGGALHHDFDYKREVMQVELDELVRDFDSGLVEEYKGSGKLKEAFDVGFRGYLKYFF